MIHWLRTCRQASPAVVSVVPGYWVNCLDQRRPSRRLAGC